MIEQKNIKSNLVDAEIIIEGNLHSLNINSSPNIKSLIEDLQTLLYELENHYKTGTINIKVKSDDRPPQTLSNAVIELQRQQESITKLLEAAKQGNIGVEPAEPIPSLESNTKALEASVPEKPVVANTPTKFIPLTESMKKEAKEMIKKMTIPFVNSDRNVGDDPNGVKSTAKKMGYSI